MNTYPYNLIRNSLRRRFVGNCAPGSIAYLQPGILDRVWVENEPENLILIYEPDPNSSWHCQIYPRSMEVVEGQSRRSIPYLEMSTVRNINKAIITTEKEIERVYLILLDGTEVELRTAIYNQSYHESFNFLNLAMAGSRMRQVFNGED